MSDAIFLRTTNLKHTYHVSDVETQVLKGVDFQLGATEFVAVLGPSGCGKTTFMNLLGGLEKASEGTISVAGETVTSLSGAQLSEYRRTKVAFIFQFYNLFPTLTARENVEAGIEILHLPRKEIRERAEYYLDAVGLAGKKNSIPAHLSGGEQQRVAIARALAKQCPLILADEPTGNLDQGTGVSVMDLFCELHQKAKTAILMITHDQGVAKNADRLVRMVNGHLVGADA